MITHKHYNIKSETNAPSAYFPILRDFVKYANVEILRNQFNLADGLTIVGRKMSVSMVYNYMTLFTYKIERKVEQKKFSKRELAEGLHLSFMKCRFRSKLISEVKFTEDLMAEVILVDKLHIKEKKAEKQLRLEYINSCSLRNLKRLYGK